MTLAAAPLRPSLDAEADRLEADLRALARRAAVLDAAHPGPKGRRVGFYAKLLARVVAMSDRAAAEGAILGVSDYFPDSLLLRLVRPQSPAQHHAEIERLAKGGAL